MYPIRIEETHLTLILSLPQSPEPDYRQIQLNLLPKLFLGIHLSLSSYHTSPNQFPFSPQVSHLVTDLLVASPGLLQTILYSAARVIFQNTNVITSISPNLLSPNKKLHKCHKTSSHNNTYSYMQEFLKGSHASYQLNLGRPNMYAFASGSR